MCNIQQFVGRVEAEASFTEHGGFFSYSKNNLKYAVWFFFFFLIKVRVIYHFEL